ncbi:MAG: prefoldin subunit [archaeon]
MADIREKIMEFEKQRQLLMSMTHQKQQLEASVNGLGKSLEELDKTTEEKVYKAAGAILVLRDAKEVRKELEELKENQSLRMKTLDKQEKSLVDKLNALRVEIESSAAPQTVNPGNTVISPKKN